jgi:hypothetical protein
MFDPSATNQHYFYSIFDYGVIQMSNANRQFLHLVASSFEISYMIQKITNLVLCQH